MAISIGWLLLACGTMVSGAGAFYGDIVLSVIGPMITFLAGYNMKYKTTFTVIGGSGDGHD